jgi:putative zinc finger/helix-turn-helix YgiT family protein
MPKVESIDRSRARTLECPECGSDRVRTEWIDDLFPFTAEGQTTELSCTVPLRICGNCESHYLDDVAETIQDDTARRHLGLLTTGELREIRERYGTQTEFGALSGIGVASLSRWESGASFQTKAFDNLMFLLRFPENGERLRDRVWVAAQPGRFRCIDITDHKRAQAQRFQLRKQA